MLKTPFIFPLIFLSFIALTACIDPTFMSSSVNPSAEPILRTMTAMAWTVEVLGKTATEMSYTATPSPAPTSTPNLVVIENEIRASIQKNLVANVGASISLRSVKFLPEGSQAYTHFYIELDCSGANDAVCPKYQAVIAVIDVCKMKNDNFKSNIPPTLQTLVIRIYDPFAAPSLAEVNWSDVKAYVNGDIPPDIFARLIKYIP